MFFILVGKSENDHDKGCRTLNPVRPILSVPWKLYEGLPRSPAAYLTWPEMSFNGVYGRSRYKFWFWQAEPKDCFIYWCSWRQPSTLNWASKWVFTNKFIGKMWKTVAIVIFAILAIVIIVIVIALIKKESRCTNRTRGATFPFLLQSSLPLWTHSSFCSRHQFHHLCFCPPHDSHYFHYHSDFIIDLLLTRKAPEVWYEWVPLFHLHFQEFPNGRVLRVIYGVIN